jgi:uncharacterized protein (TIGR03089 family)
VVLRLVVSRRKPDGCDTLAHSGAKPALCSCDVASPRTPAELLATASDPSRPFLTFYDDATGERVELSYTTLDNWVAKTANLLQDTLGTQSRERVALLLPTHWLGAVWTLAAWTAGLVVDLADPTGAEVIVAAPERLTEALGAGGRDTVAVSLAPLGRGFTEPLPPGVLDYGVEVLSHADVFTPYEPPDEATPALITPQGDVLAGGALVELATRRADELGLQPGERLLTDANPAATDGYLDALLAPLARQASVVLVRNLDPATLERRVRQEKVTLTRLRSGQS